MSLGRIRFAVGLLAFGSAFGCSTTSQVLDVLARPIGTTPAASQESSGPPQTATALLLFGGQSHDVFLGCLNCGKFDESSIWNQFGKYGSKFQSNCIWNEFGPYGSRYTATSPWNPFAGTPPIVLDSQGNFYGYFTANKLDPKRTTVESLQYILSNGDYIRSHLEEIVNGMP
jgi:hypothetical protein